VGKKRKEWAAGLHRGKDKGGGGLGRLGNMAQEVLENSKDFSISYFDSNSNSIWISNEFYMNLKLKHSIESK
jgi:hypothetical protein